MAAVFRLAKIRFEILFAFTIDASIIQGLLLKSAVTARDRYDWDSSEGRSSSNVSISTSSGEAE